MKKLLIIAAILFAANLQAQFKQATLQASGLTCAMCSNAINKALQKLPFASRIEPNIKESSFTVTFKPGSAIDFDAMRKAVEGAGFSVSKLLVKADFDNVKVGNNTRVVIQGQSLHFLDVQDQVLNGNKTFQIIDQKFVSDKVFKKYAASSKSEYTGLTAAGASKENSGGSNTRIYHVTI